MDRWARVRELVRRGLVLSLPKPEELFRGVSEPLVMAVGGGFIHAVARLERILVTRFGYIVPEIIATWFDECRELEKPFDFSCRRGSRWWQVKAVSSVKAFNSTMRRRVEEASARLPNPIILTLLGTFGKSHVQSVGRATWMDAVATWRFLTGDPAGYRTFLRILYEEAKPIRESYVPRIIELWRRERERKFKQMR